MSKYTTEVRYICETQAGLNTSVGYESVNDIIERARPKIFDFSYPIFDAEYKPVLETKILKHFYTREIGLETYGLWKLKLDTKLNEIMPFYNKLYTDGLHNIDPFIPIDLVKDYNKTGESTNEENTETNLTENTEGNTTKTDAMTGTVQDAKDLSNTRTDNLTETSTSTRTDNLLEETDETRTPNTTKTVTDSGTEGYSKSSAPKNTRYDIYSDTPQGALTGVNAENYLTNARKITDDGTGSTESNTTTFGKVVSEQSRGSETIAREIENTGTQQTSGSKSNTGTQTNRETGTDTTTHNTLDTINENTTGEKTATTTGAATNTGNTLENYIEHLKGRNGNIDFFEIAQKIRECILNIDLMIINDLDCLFMQLW